MFRKGAIYKGTIALGTVTNGVVAGDGSHLVYNLLLETGFDLLLEDNGFIILE